MNEKDLEIVGHYSKVLNEKKFAWDIYFSIINTNETKPEKWKWPNKE